MSSLLFWFPSLCSWKCVNPEAAFPAHIGTCYRREEVACHRSLNGLYKRMCPILTICHDFHAAICVFFSLGAIWWRCNCLSTIELTVSRFDADVFQQHSLVSMGNPSPTKSCASSLMLHYRIIAYNVLKIMKLILFFLSVSLDSYILKEVQHMQVPYACTVFSIFSVFVQPSVYSLLLPF